MKAFPSTAIQTPRSSSDPQPVLEIDYLTPYCLRRARTNQVSDVRLCEGLSANGAAVRLRYPFVFHPENLGQEGLLKTYGSQAAFQLVEGKLPLWDSAPKRWTQLWVYLWAFWSGILMLGSRARILGQPTLGGAKRATVSVVMSRSPALLLPVLLLKRLRLLRRVVVIPWFHEFRASRVDRVVLRWADVAACTNSCIKADLEAVGFEARKIFVTLNPISAAQLAEVAAYRAVKNSAPGAATSPENPEEAAHPRPRVVYTGKLFAGMREIDLIVEAAKLTPELDFVLTGGTAEAVAHYTEVCRSNGVNNVTMTGFLPEYRDVLARQMGADVLVSYYTSDYHNVRHNLPNKICEYMMVGVPIVTPDFPATRDILSSDNCLFVEPENPAALAGGIRIAITDPAARQKGKQAAKDVRQLTYHRVAGRLLEFLGVATA